ncbi:Nicotinamide N-methyltransferase [Neofusicoccum parvum]|uniref:Nicotinamide N-methyltransferase n=1 Tax=Neofusicoccum parvum TaxID=310453 RepID=A0ACB5SNZ5_9PEZI|nr:Nicotinamide N-methyltransferase [Neofusicoccum parvum]
MASDDESGSAGGLDLFQEPEGYYQPEKPPTYATHKLLSGEELKGHHIWNAARTISDFFESRASTIANRTVLELGAGAGLPSLVCARLGAARVVATDYPDADLIDNLRHNAAHAFPSSSLPDNLRVEGYLWGAPAAPLLAHLDPGSPDPRFDVLILADLLFNHSEHDKLVASVRATLRRAPNAVAYVFFTPYRPWLLERDLAFFGRAREAGLAVREMETRVMEKVMFEEDPGDELLRRTVFSYELRWADLVVEEEGERGAV